MSSRPIRLAITAGDARGIGPEIIASALHDPRIDALISDDRLRFSIVGPRGVGLHVNHEVGQWKPQLANQTNAARRATSDAATAGKFAGAAIETAVKLALSGEVQGIVTAPIDKAALFAGGYDYPGHTEMLAALTGCRVAMMLASDRLRVVLATTHIALRDVPAAVTASAIIESAEITRSGLQSAFGIVEPAIALCALNPHAGDGGRFGVEDDEILKPAARASGLYGPFPADTVFVRAMRGEFDAVIAPYHDVGMTAIKVASFGSAVNVTLGMPFPRTSPDHGTALDIAGKGIASAESMVNAILLCYRFAEQNSKKHKNY